MMFVTLQLLADAAGDQTQAQPGGGLLPLMSIGIIFVLFYVFMIRGPMKRQEQERQSLLGNLKKNDEVVTSGGLIGIVANISDDDEVTLKVDESSNVRIRVLKSGILRNLSKEKLAKEQKETKS